MLTKNEYDIHGFLKDIIIKILYMELLYNLFVWIIRWDIMKEKRRDVLNEGFSIISRNNVFLSSFRINNFNAWSRGFARMEDYFNYYSWVPIYYYYDTEKKKEGFYAKLVKQCSSI
ncbi:hypothetical protein A4U60_09350 [Priestia endophytica]|nr:hypothetical protein A4U60_09350 [Priestia endophytica]